MQGGVKDWGRPVRARWMRNQKGQGRFWRAVCVGVVHEVSVELCIVEGARENPCSFLGREGVLDGCISCPIHSWLWTIYLHNQLKKALGRLPPGDVQSTALTALHSAFLRERKDYWETESWKVSYKWSVLNIRPFQNNSLPINILY